MQVASRLSAFRLVPRYSSANQPRAVSKGDAAYVRWGTYFNDMKICRELFLLVLLPSSIIVETPESQHGLDVLSG